MERVWKGDPKKCPYCKKQQFPHEHDVNAWEKAPKPKKTTDTVAAITSGRRRGRPPKPETIELLRICECG